MPDPLQGVREAINRGETDRLLWPDRGQGPPVEVGQIFKLRTCHIEITRVHRVKAKGRFWHWRAEFKRYLPQRRLYLLGNRGYTDDPKAALREQAPVDAPTLTDLGDRPAAHTALGHAPEPEGVAPDEVAILPSSLAARQRYEDVQAEMREARQRLSLEDRLRLLRAEAGQNGVDLTRQFARIEQAVNAAEAKVRRLSSTPSERVA